MTIPRCAVSCGRVSLAIFNCKKPVIGAINGAAVTGGLELALSCDFLIASEQATFADTHSRVGVMPGGGMSIRLPQLIGINRARQMSLTGNFVHAATARDWGLVDESRWSRQWMKERFSAESFEAGRSALIERGSSQQ